MIDYQLIGKYVENYQKFGYELVDVPWSVPRDIINITANEDTNFEENKFMDKYLVGSAEQSFLHLINKGQIAHGRYCAVTPCFRNDEPDKWHQKYFMKLELIEYFEDLGLCNLKLEEMVGNTEFLFSLDLCDRVSIVETKDSRSLLSYDIEYKGIELGSYGIRQHEDINWVYGTGLAEPRFSTVLREKNEDHFKI